MAKSNNLAPAPVPSANRTLRRRTISVTPTKVSPSSSSARRHAVTGAAFTALGQVTSDFFKTKGQIDVKKQQIEMQQQQQAKEAEARADLLNLVDGTIADVQASAASPFQFDEAAARSSVRENVLAFMSSEKGAFVSNDTLRLALSGGDAVINELIPKTTVKLSGGVVTTIQELEGRVEVNNVVVDEEEAILNDFGTFINTHPTLAQNIINDPDMTYDEKVAKAGEYVTLLTEVKEAQILSDVKKARNPVSDKPDDVKKALAKQDYFRILKGQSRVAMGKLAQDFDPTIPGAYINLAAEYEADMIDIMLTDEAAGKLSQQYEVNVFDLVDTQTREYVTAQAQWLRSLDQLNIKKQGSEAATAEQTRLWADIKIENAKFEGQLAPSTRFIAKAGMNLSMGSAYEKMIKQSGKQVPAFDHMLKAMSMGQTRFQDIGNRILAVEDKDDPATRAETQNIMKDYFVDATNWANRDIIDSLDIRGFVTSMQAMRTSGTFKRLWPEQFGMLEEIYERAKANPENTAMFHKLERGEDVDQLIMESMREAAQTDVLEGTN
jgi:hypothetical protein